MADRHAWKRNDLRPLMVDRQAKDRAGNLIPTVDYAGTRAARRDKNSGMCPHGRIMVIGDPADLDAKRIPFKTTQTPPWTRRKNSRRRNLIAKASRRRNRAN